MKRLKKANEGSAMIIAIVVSVVVIVFCLSLLLVSYSLYASSTRKIPQTRARELAKSISIEIEKELTNPNFNTYAEEKAACEAGENPIWFYLRYNLFQDSWPYYESEDSTGHNKECAYRYFKMLSNDEAGSVADEVSVCMYWISDGSYTASKENTVLIVKVSCEMGDQTTTVTSTYLLGCGKYTDSSSALAETATGDNVNAINPNGESIDPKEHWSWSLEDRK